MNSVEYILNCVYSNRWTEEVIIGIWAAEAMLFAARGRGRAEVEGGPRKTVLNLDL